MAGPCLSPGSLGAAATGSEPGHSHLSLLRPQGPESELWGGGGRVSVREPAQGPAGPRGTGPLATLWGPFSAGRGWQAPPPLPGLPGTLGGARCPRRALWGPPAHRRLADWSSAFSSPGRGPWLGGPRQLRRGRPPAVHTAKDHAGQPQGPHILSRERARDEPLAAALQGAAQVARAARPRGDAGRPHAAAHACVWQPTGRRFQTATSSQRSRFLFLFLRQLFARRETCSVTKTRGPRASRIRTVKP